MMPAPRHMLREPRADTPTEREYGWLGRIRDAINTQLKQLIAGYPGIAVAGEIEVAVTALETALDEMANRQDELDEGGE